MQNSIATVSISGALPDKLAAIASAGFDAVEIFENDLTSSDCSPERTRALLDGLGLTCAALQPFRDFEALPEPFRTRAFDRAERKFDVMQRLGANLLLVCSSVSPAALDDAGRRAADLHELGERAAQRGLRITYEALAWGRHVYDHRDAWAAVQCADHPAVGLTLDTFHSLARGIPIESLETIDPSKVFLVQVADAPVLQLDYLSWSRHYRCFPGQGELPVGEFLTALARRGYEGGLSLEIFNDRFRTARPEHIALDGMRSLIALHDDIDRALGHGGAIPPRASCEAVEFIEFATRLDELTELGALFGQLGFQQAGRHRSKAVTHWRQGAINLVLNAEPESFASAYAVVHGASACAIGLRVQDVASVQSRATFLKIEAFRQQANPGDLELPAVVGVGGSLLYFTEPKGELADVWTREFLATGPEAPSGDDAGLDRVDHLAQTLHSDDVLSWRLYYSALFRSSLATFADILDPSGLLHSTWVSVDGGSLCLNLSEPQGRETLAARFLDRFFGNGLQHIAFGTPDMISSVDAITRRGGQMLSIPANYYEDLGARFGLTSEKLSELSSRNILYDRDERGGEMLHAFTRAHQRRFFFELVERRGGYDGVDSLGAQVRLAAQARLKPLELP